MLVKRAGEHDHILTISFVSLLLLLLYCTTFVVVCAVAYCLALIGRSGPWEWWATARVYISLPRIAFACFSRFVSGNNRLTNPQIFEKLLCGSVNSFKYVRALAYIMVKLYRLVILSVMGCWLF